jgi:hypothetical protein
LLEDICRWIFAHCEDLRAVSAEAVLRKFVAEKIKINA